MERTQIEGERARAEEALRAELRRQAAERTLGQLRLVAIMAFALLMVSAALGVWLPGMRTMAPRVLMGIGWVCAIGALGTALVAWQQVSAWTAAHSSDAGQHQQCRARPCRRRHGTMVATVGAGVDRHLSPHRTVIILQTAHS